MDKFRSGLVSVGLALLLWGCQPNEQIAIPGAEVPKEDAIGYFCNMLVSNHSGPKSQIHLSDKAEPLWFVSVRDGIAFTRLPEESRGVSALYVTVLDVNGGNQDHPEAVIDAWIEAEKASYVIESNQRGGMGAMETFPFRHVTNAEQFVQAHGGRVVSLAEIPEHYILGNTSTLMPHSTEAKHSGM